MLFPIVICGFFGGLATIFGKVSFSDNWIIMESQSFCSSFMGQSFTACFYVTLLVRALAILGIVGCNAFIVGYFLKAMEQNNTVIVVVISSAVNFLTSGILGQVMFGEKVPVTWFAGSALIALGMLLVALSEGPASTTLQRASSSNPGTASSSK